MTKILVAIPTYSGGIYCRDVFFSYLASLTTAHLSFVFVTNSGQDDAADLRERAANLQGTSTVLVNDEKCESGKDQVVSNRNILREYFLSGTWEYLFFLDHDVIGAKNAIDVLLSHNKKLTSGWYFAYFDYAKRVLPMVYVRDPKKPGMARQLSIKDVLVPRVLPVANAGLGCALLHRSILEKVAFSRNEGTEDSAFYFDVVKTCNEELWLDTRVSYWHLKFPPGDKRNDYLDPRRYKIDVKKVQKNK